MNKNKSIFVLLISILLVIFFTKAWTNDKKSILFDVGECTIPIPWGYKLGVSTDGYATFSPSMKSGFSNKSIYSVIWHKDVKTFLMKEFQKSDEKIVTNKKIKHLEILTTKDRYNHKHLFVVGHSFAIISTQHNNDINNIINQCNISWNKTRDINEQEAIKALIDNFEISREKALIILHQIKQTL